MKRILIYSILVVFVVSMALFGISCKAEAVEEAVEEVAEVIEEAEEAEEEAAEEEVGEIITLRLMMFPDNPPDEEFYDILIAEYEELNPNIKIERESVPWNTFQEKLMPQIMAETPPDIVRVSSQWGGTYAAMGALADLSEFITQEDIDKFQPGRWITCLYEEKPFGLPETNIAIAMWYNKTVIEEAGIELPESAENAWTWDEFKEAAKTVQDKTGIEYGFDVYKSFFPYLAWIYSGGGQLLGEDLKTPEINNKNSVEAVKYLTDIYAEGISPVTTPASGDADAAQKLFQAGKVAFYYSGVWLTSTFVDAIKDFEFGATYLPMKAGEAPATNASGENLIIFNNSQYIKEAYDFISWFTNKENSEKHLGYANLLSPRLDTSPTYEVRQDILEVFGNQSAMLKIQWAKETHISEFSEITPSLMDNLVLALTGKIDAQDAMDIVADEINTILAE